MLAVRAMALLSLAVPSIAAAQDFPDLKGRWNAEIEALIINLDGKTAPGPTDLNLVFEIDWQAGPRFSGYEVSNEQTGGGEPASLVHEERIAGVFGPREDDLIIVDENGERQCRVTGPDSLSCVYRHLTDDRSVVARGTWTRQR